MPDGDMAALKKLAMIVRNQANVLSFADLFVVLTVLFATTAAFTLMMAKPGASAGGGGGGH